MINKKVMSIMEYLVLLFRLSVYMLQYGIVRVESGNVRILAATKPGQSIVILRCTQSGVVFIVEVVAVSLTSVMDGFPHKPIRGTGAKGVGGGPFLITMYIVFRVR